MSTWGASFRSCDALLRRIEENDPTLQELVVLSTKTFGDAEIERLVNVLESRSNSNWKTLSASGHAVSNQSLERLGEAIGQQSIMTKLAIGHGEMGDEGVTALCRGLGRYKNPLVDIDLSYKGMGSTGLMSVLVVLGLSQNLERLNLSRNPSICSCRLRLREELAAGTKLFHNLKELDLSDCNIDDEFFEDLLDFVRPMNVFSLRVSNNLNITKLPLQLSDNGSLQKLDLSGCRISEDTLARMSQLETFCLPTLQVLDLSNNEITSTGAESLAMALQHRSGTSLAPHLRELNLSRNRFGQGATLSIVSALATLPEPIESLDLSDTECGSDGAVAAVFHSRALKLLLYGNNLASKGFEALTDSFLQCSKIEILSLDLAGNNAAAPAVLGLLNSLKREDCQLQALVIGGNENNEAVEEEIASLKQVHPQLDIARDKIRRTVA